MALLTAQKILQSGLVPTTVTPEATGDQINNTGREFFYVKNESGASVTATVIPVVTTVINQSFGKLKKENSVLSLAAGEDGFLGPFEVDAFNDGLGRLTISCSAQSNIKLSVLFA